MLKISDFLHSDGRFLQAQSHISGIIVWTITIAPVTLAVFYHNYYRHTWDNKSVFLPYDSRVYNHMAILIQSVI